MVRTRAVVVAILAAASLGGWWLGRADRGGSQSAFVTRAVDGDTIEVRIGTHTDTVRLLGVDTPERRETHRVGRQLLTAGPQPS